MKNKFKRITDEFLCILNTNVFFNVLVTDFIVVDRLISITIPIFWYPEADIFVN